MNYKRDYEYYKAEYESLKKWHERAIKEYEDLLLYTGARYICEVSYREEDTDIFSIETRDCICYPPFYKVDEIRELNIPPKYLFVAAGKLYDISNTPYKDVEDF